MTVSVTSNIVSESATHVAPSSRPADRSKPSLDALTGLRFLAAMGVVFYHFSLPILKGRSAILLNLAGAGYIAVDLFYLLSGFILTYSYLSPEGTLLGSRRNFYISRFARIYPAYFLAFVLAAPSDIATSLHVNHLATAIAKLAVSAVSVLTLQQAWTPWTAWDWNFPAWSVSVEVFFYLLFPWLAVRLARLKQRSVLPVAGLFWLLALLAPFLLWTIKGTTGPATQNRPPANGGRIYTNPPASRVRNRNPAGTRLRSRTVPASQRQFAGHDSLFFHLRRPRILPESA